MNPSRRILPLVELLGRACEGAARVEPAASPDPATADGLGTPVDVRPEGGVATTVRLLPWGQMPSEDGNTSFVWILPRGDQALRAQLRARGESFVDPAGAVRLQLPGLLVDRTDLDAVKRSHAPRTRNPFSDRATLILRTMVESGPDAVWSVREMAESAGVSLGLASYVMSALHERGLVEAGRSGRRKRLRLTDQASLIKAWARSYDWRENHLVAFHAPVGSPERFLHRLAGCFQGHRWALTMLAGASLVAPMATWDRIHLYVEAEDAESLVALGARQGWDTGEGGKVVLMLPHYRDSVWHETRYMNKLSVVSNLQLILDLWHYPLRGREQAEHLMTMPTWWRSGV